MVNEFCDFLFPFERMLAQFWHSSERDSVVLSRTLAAMLSDSVTWAKLYTYFINYISIYHRHSKRASERARAHARTTTLVIYKELPLMLKP